jgi:hypothetical protein
MPDASARTMATSSTTTSSNTTSDNTASNDTRSNNSGSAEMSSDWAIPPHVGILRILNGAHVAGAVSCLAQLGIPDLLENGPKSAEELADQIGAQPDALYRLMRATACVGVLTEDSEGRFSQTPMSAVLCRDAQPSLRGLAVMGGREWHGRGWSHLGYCVKTGKQAIDKIHGMPIFDFFSNNPEEAKIFDDAMTGLSTIDGPAVANAYNFEGIRSIVDVGGGRGLLLATLLEKNAHLKGTLYEVPRVLEGAKNGALKPFIDRGRCGVECGDMFSTIPTGADAYIMKHILHDWPDDACIKILAACRKGVNLGGKMLVVDCVIQPGNQFAPAKFLDLQMLIFPSGRERTQAEFRELFAAAGWKLSRVIPTAAADSIIEGVTA